MSSILLFSSICIIIGIAYIWHVKSRYKKTCIELKRSNELLRQFAEHINSVFWMASIEPHKIIYVSPAYEKIWGRKTESIYSNPDDWANAIIEEDRQHVLDRFAHISLAHPTVTAEYKIIRPNGSTRWILDQGFLVLDEQGKPYQIAGIATDITDRKQTELKFEHLAYHDPLTGLPNRRLLEKYIKRLVAITPSDELVAILFFDLNKFKNVNDTHGHIMGDLLLQLLTNRLEEKFRGIYFISRVGGDEFVIVLPNVKSKQQISRFAIDIIKAISRPFTVPGHEFRLNACVGMSIYPTDSEKYEELIKFADIALHYAKEKSRDNYEFFAIDMLNMINKRSELEDALNVALRNNEFILYYQPILSLNSNASCSVEALIRWRKSDNSIIEPDYFIDSAIDSGLIIPLTEWMLRNACHQLKIWRNMGLNVSHVAANITARYLSEPNFINLIKMILEKEGLIGSDLELEITENVLISDVAHTQEILHSLKQLGVKISIDDFGTGYSSFRYLKLFEFNSIKIDKSFIQDMVNSPSNLTIVKTIIAMGKSLGVKLIAEGVETKEQLDILKKLNCDEAQGYYYCQPNTADKIIDYFRCHLE